MKIKLFSNHAIQILAAFISVHFLCMFDCCHLMALHCIPMAYEDHKFISYAI